MTHSLASGKTLAFLIPAHQYLWDHPRKVDHEIRPGFFSNGKGPTFDRGSTTPAKPTSLILAPTREIGIQNSYASVNLGDGSFHRTCAVYGGAPRRHQLKDLKDGCDILIATPGRLVDILRDGRDTAISKVSFEGLLVVIYDDVECLLVDDFAEQLDM